MRLEEENRDKMSRQQAIAAKEQAEEENQKLSQDIKQEMDKQLEKREHDIA